MKKQLLSVLSIGILLFTACNSGTKKNEHEGHDMNNMSTDTSKQVTTSVDEDIKPVSITYTNVDAMVAVSVKEIVDQYLLVKNALTNENSSEAATAARAMEKAISKLDKSLFTADQKKGYDEFSEELKEHAEHIGKNGDDIKHQRSHFSMMSEDVYDLVKAFGGGRTIYHDHCPMYNEGKGAIWLSESKEIRNPYYGNKMMTCGTVEEMFK
jgi:hypothetical protein